MLLEEAINQLDADISRDPVLLLTPSYGLAGEEQVLEWGRQVAFACPQLFGHQASRIYPYGRASSLMALSYAKELLAQSPDQTIWLVGVDSLADIDLLTAMHQQGRLLDEEGAGTIPSEGAVILGITSASEGLNVLWTGSDAHLTSQSAYESGASNENDLAVKQLFQQVSRLGSTIINQIYFSDHSCPDITVAWTNQYRELAPVVNKDTEFQFPSVHTGELGSVGSLYRLAFIYEAYRKSRISGVSLQCEISDTLYRAMAMYDWG
jgi:hypothetical protein